MKVFNFSTTPASDSQKLAGMIDPIPEQLEEIKKLLSETPIEYYALRQHATDCVNWIDDTLHTGRTHKFPDAISIGDVPKHLIGHLQNSLEDEGINPVISLEETVSTPIPDKGYDGYSVEIRATKIEKVHKCWVPLTAGED